MKRDTIIPKRFARLALFAYSAALMLWGSVEGVLVLYYGRDSKALAVGGIVATGVLGILRLLTTNSFADLARPAKVLIVGVLALGFSSCATFKADASRFFKLTASCSLAGATEDGAALLKELDTATKRGYVDWRAKGEALGWDVLACALEALANVVQSRLELALAPEQMGLMPDSNVGTLVEQLGRLREGLDLANRQGVEP